MSRVRSIQLFLSGLKNTPILRAVAVLAGGTAAAQVVAIAMLPVLTRIYAPSEFSVFAIYLSIVTIASTIGCWRLEIAIPMQTSDHGGASLLVTSVCCAFASASIIAVSFLLFGPALSSIESVAKLGASIWVIPITVFLAASFSAAQYWATRKQWFANIAKTRLLQASVGTGSQAGLGLLGLGATGLMIGHAAFASAGTVGLAVKAWKQDKPLFSGLRVPDLINALSRNKRFAFFSMPESLANSAALEVPVLLIAIWAAGPEAGLLFLASRIIGVPMQMIGAAVGQVFLSQAPVAFQEGRLARLTLVTMRNLSLIGAATLGLGALLAPLLFAVIFGEEWRRAGYMVQWLAPAFLLQFIASPVSMVLHILGRQIVALGFQILSLIIRVGTLVLVHQMYGHGYVAAFAASGALVYLIYVCVIISAVFAIKPKSLPDGPKVSTSSNEEAG